MIPDYTTFIKLLLLTYYYSTIARTFFDRLKTRIWDRVHVDVSNLHVRLEVWGFRVSCKMFDRVAKTLA